MYSGEAAATERHWPSYTTCCRLWSPPGRKPLTPSFSQSASMSSCRAATHVARRRSGLVGDGHRRAAHDEDVAIDLGGAQLIVEVGEQVEDALAGEH
jgi:hypothetical protein